MRKGSTQHQCVKKDNNRLRGTLHKHAEQSTRRTLTTLSYAAAISNGGSVLPTATTASATMKLQEVRCWSGAQRALCQHCALFRSSRTIFEGTTLMRVRHHPILIHSSINSLGILKHFMCMERRNEREIVTKSKMKESSAHRQCAQRCIHQVADECVMLCNECVTKLRGECQFHFA